MFRNILSSRLIQVGLVFFVLIVGGSLLYNWHVQRTTKAELARTDVVLQDVNRDDSTHRSGHHRYKHGGLRTNGNRP